MDSVDIEVLRSAQAWRKAGHRATLGTIVKTWGSAPRPVGALVAIRDDGQISGSVSGGCVEDDLVEKVRARAVAAERPQVMTYGVTNEEATRWGLPCGGTLQLVLEPVGEASGLGELLETISRQQLVRRRLEMDSGRVTLEPGQWQDALEFDGKVLTTVHGPRWRLVMIGAGQLTRYLAQMARMLDYYVIVIDPREEYADAWDVPGVAIDRGMPDDVIAGLNLDGHSAVVALTHDPKLDEREFKVEASVGAPQVAYREAITKTVQAEGKYIKQTGGRGKYGHVWIRIEPVEPGSGFEFVNEVVGGTVPREYIGAVENGIKDQMKNGVLAGYPIEDARVALYDGSYHDVDSDEVSFRMAGSMAFKKGALNAGPALLEPMMKVEVVTPEEYMGDVMGDLNRRRGIVQGMEDTVTGKAIRAEVPLGEMFGYATDLRSMSQGRASYSMEFCKYAQAPNNIAEAIIKKTT